MPRQKRQRLKKQKDGRYYCKYHGVMFSSVTEEEALEKREEYKRKERLGEIVRKNPTVREYAEAWLPVAKAGLRYSTQAMCRTHLRHLYAVLGDVPVREVKPMQIRRVYSAEYAGSCKGHISHAKALFTALFRAAQEEGLIQTNPAAMESAKPPKAAKEGSHRAITLEERRLIDTVALDHPVSPVALVMLYAGLRPQEAKALRVEDVDFDNNRIFVHSQIHLTNRNQHMIDEDTKTKKSTRYVPLLPPVRAALMGKTGLIVSMRDGRPVSVDSWKTLWRSYCAAMEEHMNGMTRKAYLAATKKGESLPPWRTFDVSPYDLRHSFVTWCRDNDIELHTVIEWVGHTDATMILHIYDEVNIDRSKKQAEKLEKAFLSLQTSLHENTDKPDTS